MRKEKPRVIHFSGGKTSALMTILLKPTEKDIVLFTDTCREHEKTYKFIHDFEAYEGIKVHKTCRTKHIDAFGAYVTKNKFLPNVTRRSCTGALKIETARKYVRELGIREYDSYIGFRADELERVNKYQDRYKKVQTKFPLVEAKIYKGHVEEYWKNKPYTLEIPSILGNCDLCFLKGKGNLIRIMSAFPELADKWIHDEEVTGHTYIKGISYKELKKIATSQLTIFDEKELHKLEAAFNCSCTA